MDNKKEYLSLEKHNEILGILKIRFEDNMVRHKEIAQSHITAPVSRGSITA